MSDNQGSNKILPLIIGVVVGIAIGLGIGQVLQKGGGEDGGSRGEWHDSPSPQTSPERIVNANLDEIQALNAASDPAQNPQKPAIEQKLTQLMDPAFTPADRIDAAIRVHNAWKYATKGVWASVHEELEPIN